MKPGIKFIGTGSGKTSLKRFHSSFLISSENYNLLVDAGDGISRALLSYQIDFSHIDGILLTHLHPDHYSGLASLIVQMKLTGRDKNLQIFVHKKLEKVVKDFLYRSYIFRKKMNFKIKAKTFNHDEIFKIKDSFNFTAKQNTHLEKYKKYAGKGKLNFISSSILFEISGKKIFYTGDVGKKEDLYLFKDDKMDIIISEVTHLNIKDLNEAYQILNPKKLYLTHISDDDSESFEANFAKESNIIPVVDGFTIQF
jgi:ribonuclease BN (tRNA processing enzyme)